MMANSATDRPWEPEEPERRPDLYSAGFLLPTVVGACAVAGGLAMYWGGGSPVPAREFTFDAGIALVVVGVVSYFLIGLWLIPTAVAIGGLALLASYAALVHARSQSIYIGGLAVGLGILGLLWASLWLLRRHPESP